MGAPHQAREVSAAAGEAKDGTVTGTGQIAMLPGLFFVSYVVLVGMVILNIVVAVLLDGL